MWAFRYYLDNMLPHTFYHTFPPDGEDKVQYAQIMQYERGDNKNNGFVKRRLVRAWQEGGVGTWQDISQPFNYSTNDLEQIIIDIE
jgi:hypothetical protein